MVSGKERLREAKILQYLVELQKLGLECYHKDGRPMIVECRKGRISSIEALQEEQIKFNILSYELERRAIDRLEKIKQKELLMDNQKDLEDLKKGLIEREEAGTFSKLMKALAHVKEDNTKNNSLEERQAEWDKKYDSPNSEPVKQRPARPNKEDDEFIKKEQQSLNSYSYKRQLEKQKTISISNLKGELLHLILSNIHTQELKWMEENRDKEPTTKLEQMYKLIGKIVDVIKR